MLMPCISCIACILFFFFFFYSCFINDITIFFAAFLGPILLVLAFNVVIFVVVIVILVKHLIKRSKEKVNSLSSLKLVLNITGVCCLLGLTWIFGALTITKANQAFQIIFTVTNSLQGFYIFLFFCVLNGDVRSTWLKTLPCKHLTSMVTHTTKESSKSQSTSGSALLSHSHSNSKEVESDHAKDKGRSAQVEERMELTMVNNYGNVEN